MTALKKIKSNGNAFAKNAGAGKKGKSRPANAGYGGSKGKKKGK